MTDYKLAMIKTNKDGISRNADNNEGYTTQTKVKSVYKTFDDDDDIKAKQAYNEAVWYQDANILLNKSQRESQRTTGPYHWIPGRHGVLLVFDEFCLVWEGFVSSCARDLCVSYLSAMKSSIFATVVAVTSMYRRQFRF